MLIEISKAGEEFMNKEIGEMVDKQQRTTHKHRQRRRYSRRKSREDSATPQREKPAKEEKVEPDSEHTAMHNRTDVFFPDPQSPQSTLTPKSIASMHTDSSEEDTLSPIIMADLVSKMTTYKREETLEILHDMIDENTGKPKANKIIALIKYVPPRTGKHLPTGESYKQRKARKLADEIIQKEVMRKLRKWDAVCRKASLQRHW